jgi:hypothetical protein
MTTGQLPGEKAATGGTWQVEKRTHLHEVGGTKASAAIRQ